MQRYTMYIGGESTEAASGRWMDSENPFSGDVWARVTKGDGSDVERAVQAAHKAYAQGAWKELAPSQRGLLLHKMGDLILRDARRLAEGRAMRMAEGIQAGSVWINCYRQVSFQSPFGGYKDSGVGRENGPDAVNEYLQVKSVWLNTGAPVPNPYAPR